ncbi:hypothetical protein DTL42_14045 [Bremerella cremea]|uniref:Uncharacterized protein n=1 Tax=Bremerella cremea TaxID=1031537 RepID=A0A368KPU1_9BACT|nr:hypothetical protein [Bremerella cremea]RCS47641.1 hypothetical protein DTL42_14045 [Bremerella cremea]
MAPQPQVPYDTWSISEKDALNVAEATLRYQFEQADKSREVRKKKWLVLVFGDSASPEFLSRFSDRTNLIEEVGDEELTPSKIALFAIQHAKRIDATTISVTTSTIGVDPSEDRPVQADLVAVLKDGQWKVDPSQPSQQ